MSKIETGGPAFPCKAYTGMMQEGMTLRDHFAGLALASGEATDWHGNGFKPRDGFSIIQNTAFAAYEFADAMLAARNA